MPSLLDFIFPKKCVNCGSVGDYFCAKCKKKIVRIEKPICPICMRQAVSGKTHPGCRTRYSLDGLVFGCRYKGPVKIAIKKVKYKWVFDIEKDLVELVADQIWQFDIPEKPILAPVPLHEKRKNWRGFNQAEILAKNLSKKFKVDYADILVRNRDTQTQVGLDKTERKKNVKDAFSLKNGVKVAGKSFMLVDDVYTSGATLAECARVLKRAKAKSVWGMVVAIG